MRKSYNNWTQEEVDYLKNNYGKICMSELIKNLNHTKIAIYHKAIEELKLHSVIGYHLWKQEEINYLKENYGKIIAHIIGQNLNRSEPEIRRKAIKLSLKSNLIGFKNKKHTEATKKLMSLKREKWYLNNKKKAILKGKNVSKALKGKTWEILFGKERAFEKKELKRKRMLNEEYNPTKNKGHSDKTKKLLSKISYKRYEENPKLKKIISKSVRKLWQNPLYAKNQRLKVIEGLNQRPSLPEKQVIQIIEINNLPFNYTGDGKETIYGFNPDFLCENKKYIIEVYGEYHHNLPKGKERNKRRIKAYNLLGYKLLVIWSKELQNPQKVTEKIVNFVSK